MNITNDIPINIEPPITPAQMMALHIAVGYAILGMIVLLATFKHINNTYDESAPFRILKIECLVTLFFQLGKIAIIVCRVEETPSLVTCVPSITAVETNLCVLFGTRVYLFSLSRYYSKNAERYTKNGYPSDDQLVFKYLTGLVSSGIWNLFVAFLDGYNQVYALPPNRACMMSSSSHRPDLHFLITFLMWGPYVMLSIYKMAIKLYHYISNTTLKDIRKTLKNGVQSLQNHIQFYSALLVATALIFMTWRIISFYVTPLGGNLYWLLIAFCYFSITIDVVKVPLQLKVTHPTKIG